MNDVIFLLIMSLLLPAGIFGLLNISKINKVFMNFVKNASITYNVLGLPVSPDGWNKFVLTLMSIFMIIIGSSSLIMFFFILIR